MPQVVEGSPQRIVDVPPSFRHGDYPNPNPIETVGLEALIQWARFKAKPS